MLKNEVSKFPFSTKSGQKGGGVESYHDNIRRKMSQKRRRGVHQRAEIKVAKSQQQIVPGRRDEIMLLEGSEGKCHCALGARSASVSARRVEVVFAADFPSDAG